MKNQSGFAIVKVSEYKGENASPDKNGRSPMYLHPICGEIPNRNVIAGTVAHTQNFSEDGTFLAQWTLGEKDPTYGQRVNWTNLSEGPMTAIDVVTVASGALFNGEAGSIVDVNTGLPVKKEEATPAKGRKAQAG